MPCRAVSPSDTTTFSLVQVGLTRQGVVCEVCGFACHIQCREKVPAACPVPPDQSESTYILCLDETYFPDCVNSTFLSPLVA